MRSPKPTKSHQRLAKAIRRLLGFHRIARIRDRLNRMTRGRVGLYSTAEHYSTGPGAKVLRYYQYDEKRELTCRSCGWVGPGARARTNFFSELFDVRCPSCNTMLLVVGFPTLGEIEDAAKRGNREAQAELGQICRFEADANGAS